MTDAIAGLSENLRTPWKDSEGYFVLPSKRDLEAATALDALQADLQVKEQAIADLGRAIHKWQSERDALQARVKELEAERDRYNTEVRLWKIEHDRKLDSTRRRCTRLQQELDTSNDNHRAMEKQLAMVGEDRDEAYERAAKVADKIADGLLAAAEKLQGYIGATKLAYTEADLHEQAGTAIKALVDEIRRLAGPEKEGE